MTNLGLLRSLCRSVRIQVPESTAVLTAEQSELLRMLNEAHAWVCTRKKWWFNQRTTMIRTVKGVTSGLTASVSGSVVTVSGGTPFVTTAGPDGVALSTQGKLVFAGARDLMAVNATTSTVGGPQVSVR